MGPICRGNRKGETVAVTEEREFDDEYLTGHPPSKCGYLWQRGPAGRVLTNVPHRVVSHSPSGFEFGFGGSGPADLALNVLEDFFSRHGYTGPRTECYDGSCFAVAWTLHQDFKATWIAGCDQEEGGGVSFEDIRTWLRARRAMGWPSVQSMAMATTFDWDKPVDFDASIAHYNRWLSLDSVNEQIEGAG
jgi:hypothetical protein